MGGLSKNWKTQDLSRACIRNEEGNFKGSRVQKFKVQRLDLAFAKRPATYTYVNGLNRVSAFELLNH
jgi:hypothetical protein